MEEVNSPTEHQIAEKNISGSENADNDEVPEELEIPFLLLNELEDEELDENDEIIEIVETFFDGIENQLNEEEAQLALTSSSLGMLIKRYEIKPKHTTKNVKTPENLPVARPIPETRIPIASPISPVSAPKKLTKVVKKSAKSTTYKTPNGTSLQVTRRQGWDLKYYETWKLSRPTSAHSVAVTPIWVKRAKKKPVKIDTETIQNWIAAASVGRNRSEPGAIVVHLPQRFSYQGDLVDVLKNNKESVQILPGRKRVSIQKLNKNTIVLDLSP